MSLRTFPDLYFQLKIIYHVEFPHLTASLLDAPSNCFVFLQDYAKKLSTGFVPFNGDCLFRSLRLGLDDFFDDDLVSTPKDDFQMRTILVDYVGKHFDRFGPWTVSAAPQTRGMGVVYGEPSVYENARAYTEALCMPGCYGGFAEVIAFAELFKVPVTVMTKHDGELQVRSGTCQADTWLTPKSKL